MSMADCGQGLRNKFIGQPWIMCPPWSQFEPHESTTEKEWLLIDDQRRKNRLRADKQDMSINVLGS